MSYVIREVDILLENDIENLDGTLFFLMGEGGVGKSTLLKKFLTYNKNSLPVVYIDIKNDFEYSKTFSNVLLDRDTTIMKNCPNIDEARKIIDDNPQFFSSILDSYSEELSAATSKLDDKIESNVKIVYDSIKLLSKFSKRNYEKKKNEIKDNMEFSLLKALQKDFKNGGLFMFDTYEKVKDIRIMSQVDFIDTEISKKSLEKKGYHLGKYLKKLRKSLGEKTTFLIASRSIDSVFQNIDKAIYLNVPEFSKSEIKTFFKQYQHDIGLPSSQQLRMIKELTNGNPLILSYFPSMVKEYTSWNDINYEEMQKRVTNDSLLNYLFNSFFKNRIDSSLQNNIWKLVIPRVLTEQVLKFIFPNEDDRRILLDERILTKGIAYDTDKYYLHDNVLQAIKSDLSATTKDTLYSFHDLDEIQQLHLDLVQYYRTLVNFKNLDFEVCYHKIMTIREFEKKFDITREEFSNFLLGSFSWKYMQKVMRCNELELYSDYKIERLIEKLEQERDIILPEIGETLYSEFVNYTLSTKNQYGIYDITYLQKLLKTKSYSNQWVIYYVMGNTYFFQNQKEEAFKAYKLALEKVDQKDMVFFKMGLVFYKNGNYNESVNAYKEAIKINKNNYKYYTNLGVVYNTLDEYKLSKETLLYANSLNPKDKTILLNLALVYTKLEEFDDAIQLYTILLEQNPLNYQLHYGLGKAHYLMKNYISAKESFEEALRIDDSSVEVRKCLAGCNIELGEYNQAKDIYIPFIEKNDNDYSESIDCVYDCFCDCVK